MPRQKEMKRDEETRIQEFTAIWATIYANDTGLATQQPCLEAAAPDTTTRVWLACSARYLSLSSSYQDCEGRIAELPRFYDLYAVTT